MDSFNKCFYFYASRVYLKYINKGKITCVLNYYTVVFIIMYVYFML